MDKLPIPDIHLPKLGLPKITWVRLFLAATVWYFTPTDVKDSISDFASTQIQATPELVQTVQATGSRLLPFPSQSSQAENTRKPTRTPIPTNTPVPTETPDPTSTPIPREYLLGCQTNDYVFTLDVRDEFIAQIPNLRQEITQASNQVIKDYQGNVPRGIAWGLVQSTTDAENPLKLVPSCPANLPVLKY